MASRQYKNEYTTVDVKGVRFGNGYFSYIAGPCAIESYDVLAKTASEVKKAGAGMLRGGAFKPRTSPYTFQGLGKEGLEILTAVGKELDMPTVSEITDPRQLELFDNIDMLQVGTRNMQNYELLKELGNSQKPVLLKRGMGSTIEEFLMCAEYILSGGNMNVVLCERGIRTFSPAFRNTFDIGGIVRLKTITHLPVIGDPSHSAGIAYPVPSLSFAAAAAGADGLMLEVHSEPEKSLSDAEQAIDPECFGSIVKKVDNIRKTILEK